MEKTLRAWLDKKGLTVTQFARLSGIPRTSIQRHLELGQGVTVRTGLRIRAATRKQVSWESLAGFPNERELKRAKECR